ncbi:hypothetical protein ONZ51_g3549 [Trametes cubensis]|uniref:Protein kinase domain-containing protein n=1 Tax=Trametes cubensis TaxID=1111947 RepID=A0AAD7TY03_9APHY|nr:hypothetical protein ONZ51_g3549 [Trametes cubensis]
MAPEMCHPEVERIGYGAAVDVWSLGVVFLQIFGLSNLWGFEVQTWSRVVESVEERLPAVRAFLSSKTYVKETAETAILQMLDVDPVARIFVENLYNFVPQHTWAQVQSQTQTHDWRPDPSQGPRNPHQRDLEFATYRDRHREFLSETAPSYARRVREFRIEQESARAFDFEYRARGAFGDA